MIGVGIVGSRSRCSPLLALLLCFYAMLEHALAVAQLAQLSIRVALARYPRMQQRLACTQAPRGVNLQHVVDQVLRLSADVSEGAARERHVQ